MTLTAQAQIGHTLEDVKKHYGNPTKEPQDAISNRKIYDFETGQLYISIWISPADKVCRLSIAKKDGTGFTSAECFDFLKKEAPHIAYWVLISFSDDHKIWLKGLDTTGKTYYFAALYPTAMAIWTEEDNVNTLVDGR